MSTIQPFVTSKLILATVTLIFILTDNTAQAINGAQLAQQLNTKYQDTTINCVGPDTSPVFKCSGVLVSTIADDHPRPFWSHDATALLLGTEPLVYLRADIGTRTLESDHGGIYLDPVTAEDRDKPIEVLCAYPFALNVGTDWFNHGCLRPGIPRAEDSNSCAVLGVTNAADWIAYFNTQNYEPEKQCSLSSQIAEQFKVSMEVHQQIGPAWAAKPNELLVKNWDDTRPTRVPVLALFYNVRDQGALLKAQLDQFEYFQATGYWLPILQLDLTQENQEVFSFGPDDQLFSGFEVAARLNSRYANTSPCPDEQAAYTCNGVLYRGVDVSEEFHSWNPSPGNVSRNGVSFSYLRSDIGPTVLETEKQGLIFKELSPAVSYPVSLRCAYPFDASTSSASDACIRIQGRCEELGITKYSQYVERFGSLPPVGLCSFAPSPAQFQLSIDVRGHFPQYVSELWNEIVFGAWAQDIPLQLPLEAFTYLPEGSDGQEARFIQLDYFNETGRFLPVIRLTRTERNGQIFSYYPDEQSFLNELSRKGPPRSISPQ